MTAAELLIIGAGPAGLALSQAYAGPSRILERAGEVGGLCRSIEFGGGVFDIGGHSFHSPHAEVLDLVGELMEGRWSAQRRDARVAFGEALIDYPFQNHFHQLADQAVVEECRAGLPPTGAAVEATNFEDWIQQRFGPGVARHFMLPYNRKLWARDLSRISCEWVGERIVGAEKAPAALPTRQPLQTGTQVGYPAEGGFVEIFKAMAERCGPIMFGQEAARIDPAARMLVTAAGDRWAFDRLASTMPLPALLRAIDGCPPELIEAADRLEFLSLKLLLILVAKPLGDQPQRVYSADPRVPSHKIAFNHASSLSLRARPVHAIMCEISYSPEKPLAPEAELERTMVDWLVAHGLVDHPDDVAETRFVDVKYGYPVYTHDRPAKLERIRDWLEGQGIFTLGRFGGWDYVNSDACIRQGLDLAARLS